MRLCLYLAAGVALAAPCPALLRAGDTPADHGADCVGQIGYACDKVHEQCDYIQCPGSMFYVQAEGLLIRREVTNTDFPATSLGVAGPVIARLQNLSFNFESGIRLTAGYRCDAWWSAEFTYFGQLEWESQFVATDPQGRLFGVLNRFGTAQQPTFPSPPFPATFGTGNNTTAQAGVYNARLNNFEANVVRDLFALDVGGGASPRLSMALLGGLRYMRLVEDFRLVTSGNVIPSAGINDPAAFADYRIDTENNMFGGQLGFRLGVRLWDALTVGTEGKVAILGNGAEQTSNVAFAFVQPAPILGLLSTSDGDMFTTVVPSVKALVSWDVTDSLTVRGGYELMWLTNRALAPDQVDPNVAVNNAIMPMLNKNGTTLFYGGFAGIEYRF